jgi:hypothetical protein
MNISTAHALLNQVKLGMPVTQAQILQALYVTGDLDVHKIAPRAGKSLCTNGPKSIYSRSSSLEDEGIGEGFKWSLDWNRKRDSSQIEGVEK